MGAFLTSGCTLQAAAMTPLPAAVLADVTNVIQTSSPAANSSPLASVPVPEQAPQVVSTSLAAACGLQTGPDGQAPSLVESPDVRPLLSPCICVCHARLRLMTSYMACRRQLPLLQRPLRTTGRRETALSPPHPSQQPI